MALLASRELKWHIDRAECPGGSDGNSGGKLDDVSEVRMRVCTPPAETNGITPAAAVVLRAGVPNGEVVARVPLEATAHAHCGYLIGSYWAPGVMNDDPVAMTELARDVRPPDYARTFAWQASALAGLESVIAVTAVNRPPWLAEVASQPGVVECGLTDALTLFSRGTGGPSGAA